MKAIKGKTEANQTWRVILEDGTFVKDFVGTDENVGNRAQKYCYDYNSNSSPEYMDCLYYDISQEKKVLASLVDVYGTPRPIKSVKHARVN